MTQRLIEEDSNSERLIKRFLVGKNIKRYQVLVSDKFLIFTRRGIDIKKYSAIENYLSQYKNQLTPKPKDWKPKNKDDKWKGRKTGTYKWYEIQDAVDYHLEFEKPKIIIPAIVQKASYAFDQTGFYSNDKTSIISVDDFYLLGILNSKVPDFFLHSIASTKQGGYFEYKPMYVEQLPIRTIDLNKSKGKAQHGQMVELVESMMNLNQRLAETKTGHEKTVLQRQIDATDQQIDQLVYELYDLTEEEIKIVEESVG